MLKEDIAEVIRLYAIHKSIVHRCTSTNNKAFKDYGGRGIFVCEEWKDPTTFVHWAMENGAQKGLELDRSDNDGPYAPWNCRFVTRKENRSNRRPAVYKNAIKITAFGETKLLAEWIDDDRCTITKATTLYDRYRKKGWSGEQAITLPLGARPSQLLVS